MTPSDCVDPIGRQPLFTRVCTWETLLSAWDRVESNDGAPGVDGVTLSEFELRLEERLKELRRNLRERIYQPQPLLRAFRPKPSGGLRPLAIATVRDRVAQTAVALVITPIVDREFEPVSFGDQSGYVGATIRLLAIVRGSSPMKRGPKF